jgi:cell wall-associated NlpC family hydrolase
MKKIRYLLLVLLISHFLSACSQAHRSNVNYNAQNGVQNSTNNYNKNQYNRQSSQRAQASAVNKYHPTRNLMVRIATSTIGTPYRWGGDNPQKGFDCSGLMTYVHKNALGLKIPRTAAKQRDASRTINYAQLQPGDMLFFKTGKRSNHVGVYIGNRKFVHAATGSKHVKVASMDNAYWHRRFVKFGTFL